MAREEQKSGCLKALTVGCGCLLVVAILAAALVSWNWGRMRGAVESVVSTMSDLQDLQATLAARYGARQVGVQRMHRSGTDGPILRIQIAGAPFMEEIGEAEWGAKAIEIAAAARDAYSARDDIALYEIELSSHGPESGSSYSRTFTIRSEDLPPPSMVTATPPAANGSAAQETH